MTTRRDKVKQAGKATSPPALPAQATTLPALRALAAPSTSSPASDYIASLAPGSRRAQGAALVRVASLLRIRDPNRVPWHELRPAHVDWIRAQLADQAAPATCNRILSALRGVLRAAWRAGLIDAASYQAARDVRGVKGSRLPRGRAVEREEWHKLFAEIALEQSPVRERDAALVALAYACGFRRSELVALDVADYDRDSGRLRVVGKGNKERAIYVNNGAKDWLHAWLRVRGPEPGPLLLSVDRHATIGLHRLSAQAVYARMMHLAERSGVKAFSPHDCRRSLAGDLLDSGIDLATVQAVLGHSSPATTARYDRRGERAVRDAARKVSVPFSAR